MTNICSIWAYEDIKSSGYVGRNQARYIYIFANASDPLTHKQATKLVENEFLCKMPERNGRIAELEAMGYVEKVDHVRCEYTHKIVNRWKWSGRKSPFQKAVGNKTCPRCDGTGRIEVEYYERTPERQKGAFQKELF